MAYSTTIGSVFGSPPEMRFHKYTRLPMQGYAARQYQTGAMWTGCEYPNGQTQRTITNCKNCAAPTKRERDDCAYCGTII